jgi:electron transport complex protein RnfC
MSRRLWTFHGGLHLPEHKAESTGQPLRVALLPRQIILPLHQHIGAPAKPVVEVGEHVLKGQMVAQPEGYVSAPVHASTSGTVVAIEERPIPHPSGLDAPCIIIEPDGEDTWHASHQAPETDYTHTNPSHLRNIIRDAGIVGLGGAGFPTFIKLNPGPRTEIETLILNGAECEPYITCDDMLMRERADEVVAGARIMRHALHARECVIGIEDNKPEAIAAIREALGRASTEIELVVVPTRYPTGGEKQLIKIITGKEVPSQGLPIDVGIVCHNVSTAAAVYRAVERAEPLISRVVTVTGAGAAQPQNVEVRIGTPVADVLEFCGGTAGSVQELLLGGPMMGVHIHDMVVPITKTANCILAMSAEELSPYRRGPARNCIRCGACTEACPASLLPQQLYWHARAKDFDKAQDYNLFDCIECGCCAFVCPSNLPLVQFYRFAKTEIWAQEREKKKSDLARRRHEFRVERQEREKAERAARMKAKKAAVKSGGDDKKKEAIKAAMERAKAKRDQGEAKPKNVDDLTPEQQRKIAEVDARRAKSRETETAGANGDNDNDKGES